MPATPYIVCVTRSPSSSHPKRHKTWKSLSPAYGGYSPSQKPLPRTTDDSSQNSHTYTIRSQLLAGSVPQYVKPVSEPPPAPRPPGPGIPTAASMQAPVQSFDSTGRYTTRSFFGRGKFPRATNWTQMGRGSFGPCRLKFD